jgi:hypothetical protein
LPVIFTKTLKIEQSVDQIFKSKNVPKNIAQPTQTADQGPLTDSGKVVSQPTDSVLDDAGLILRKASALKTKFYSVSTGIVLLAILFN